MKKVICILGYVIILILAGCQTQPDLPNTETNLGQTTVNSTPAPDSTSESNSVNAEADSDQANKKDSTGRDNKSEYDTTNTPTLPDETVRDVNSVEIGNDNLGWATITVGEHELKSEGSLRGEIEVTHKLTCGTMTLDEGDTVIFSLGTPLTSAKLKITLTGTQTGAILEGFVTGVGDVSFEANKADEYIVILENCSLSGVQFTIDYSFGGSK